MMYIKLQNECTDYLQEDPPVSAIVDTISLQLLVRTSEYSQPLTTIPVTAQTQSNWLSASTLQNMTTHNILILLIFL